jgi:UDP-2,4-diacetamido-2,4,6-trideoxy-beta-L-altropyranose hydrolase
MRNLVIRADAGLRIGSGHVMRCLALAQAWQSNGGKVLLLGACDSDPLRERMCAAGIQFLRLPSVHPAPGDLEATLRTLDLVAEEEGTPGGRLVLDGYHFGPDYQRAVRAAGHRLLVVDDNAHQPFYDADLVLNQNLHAGTLHYACPEGTELLLGTRYALLRPEFHACRDARRRHPDRARRLLVTLGGGDPGNATLTVLRALALAPIDGLEARIVVGSQNPHGSLLREEAKRLGLGDSVRLLAHPAEMPELMAWADLAVSAAGTTCWELAFLGVPAALGIVADNQEAIAAALEGAGAAVSLGWFRALSAGDLAVRLGALAEDAAARSRLGRLAQRLVDGGGAARVVAALERRPVPDPASN